VTGVRLRIFAGAIDDFATGEPRIVALPPDRFAPRREALVVRDEHGALRGFVNRCKHLPIPLDSGSRQVLAPDRRHFLCRTHGALYRITDGACVAGPCSGRALEALDVELDAGRVFLLVDAS
jgi:nitrite reductase/ring-hydroxylating ferredoxin subunit